MKRLTTDDIAGMTDGELVDTLVKTAYDMGVARVYLEAKNHEDDEYNVELMIKELERRLT